MMIQMAQMGRAKVSAAGTPLPYILTADRVCYSWERRLVCLDLLTGDVLWQRDDVPADDVFGDDELVFVTATTGVNAAGINVAGLNVAGGAAAGANATGSNATVYSMIDGRELGQRAAGDLREAVHVAGRRVVTWHDAGDRGRLTCRDVWSGETRWDQEVVGKAMVCVTPAAEIATLTTTGHFALRSAATGAVRAAVDLPPIADLEGLFVLAGPERYYVIASRPIKDDPVGIGRQVHPGQRLIHGRITALAPDGGKILWSAEVTNQWLPINLPAGLPVLPMVRPFQVFTPQPQGGFSSSGQKTHWTALHAATGRVLFEETRNEGDWNAQTTVDVKQRRLEVQGQQMSLRFTWP
jgi:hypothetical protein